MLQWSGVLVLIARCLGTDGVDHGHRNLVRALASAAPPRAGPDPARAWQAGALFRGHHPQDRGRPTASLRSDRQPPGRMSGDRGRPPPAQILTTKLYIPRTRPTLVPRPRLTERLNAGLSGMLTLIAAPAGFGKT